MHRLHQRFAFGWGGGAQVSSREAGEKDTRLFKWYSNANELCRDLGEKSAVVSSPSFRIRVNEMLSLSDNRGREGSRIARK